MKVLMFIFFCLHFVKGNDEIKFNATLIEIRDSLRKSFDDFIAFCVQLESDSVALTERIQEIQQSALSRKEQILFCSQKLTEDIAALDKEFKQTLDASKSAQSIINTYAEYVELTQTWQDNFQSYRNYYSCTDDECREKFRKLAEEQLEKAVNGWKIKEIQQKLGDLYPDIVLITKEYDDKLNEIINAFERCKE